MRIVKLKVSLAALLALFVGSCSCLVPLAAAASSKQDHSCCPSPSSTDSSADCCLRAVPPVSVSVSLTPHLYVIGLVNEAPGFVSAAQNVIRLDCAALSPPAQVFVASRSSRAPPFLLA